MKRVTAHGVYYSPALPALCRSFRICSYSADSPEGYFLDSFDYTALLSELLDPLGPGGTRRFRRAVFDCRSDRSVAVLPETAGAEAILLFDGVFLQRPELAGAWDILIGVDAPFEVTVRRAVSRDASGTDRAAVIRAQYEGRYVPGQLMYMDRCRPKESADIVVNNTDLESPDLRYRRFGFQPAEPATRRWWI
jgi:uridine kinase